MEFSIAGNRATKGMIVAGLLCCTARADSSGVPFYYANPTVLEPQVASLAIPQNENVGGGMVSRDRKYVTMDVDPQLLSVASINSFTFQKTAYGFVGSASAAKALSGRGAVASSAVAGRNSFTPTIAASAGEVAPPDRLLETRGMTRVAGLPPGR